MIRFLKRILSGNRRAFPRIETSLEVTLEFPEEADSESIQTRSLNVSAGGVEVELDKPLPVTSSLKVSLLFPGETEPIALRGTVVRCIQNRSLFGRFTGNSGVYSIAIEFSDMDRTLRNRVVGLLHLMIFGKNGNDERA